MLAVLLQSVTIDLIIQKISRAQLYRNPQVESGWRANAIIISRNLNDTLSAWSNGQWIELQPSTPAALLVHWLSTRLYINWRWQRVSGHNFSSASQHQQPAHGNNILAVKHCQINLHFIFFLFAKLATTFSPPRRRIFTLKITNIIFSVFVFSSRSPLPSSSSGWRTLTTRTLILAQCRAGSTPARRYY